MEISKIDNIDFNTIQRVLASNKISEKEKTEFINNNSAKINQVMQTKISSPEYTYIMQHRPLQKFKPLKNSYTKRGDKILLSKSLDIPVSHIDSHVKQIAETIGNTEFSNIIETDELNTIKTYVYRHGTQEEVVAFLKYELATAKSILKALYRTLEYNTAGVADYFQRPIHRMHNDTMVKMYSVIDNSLHNARENGEVTEISKEETAKWALTKIYQIQNNSKLINAIRTYESL